MSKYTMPSVLKEYFKNKDKISAYFNKKGSMNYGASGSNATTTTTIPPLLSSSSSSSSSLLIMEMEVEMFLLFSVLVMTVWVWAVIVLIQYWDKLPSWAKVAGLLSLLTEYGGPVVTLIIVYIAKEDFAKNIPLTPRRNNLFAPPPARPFAPTGGPFAPPQATRV